MRLAAGLCPGILTPSPPPDSRASRLSTRCLSSAIISSRASRLAWFRSTSVSIVLLCHNRAPHTSVFQRKGSFRSIHLIKSEQLRKYENYCVNCADCDTKKHTLPCYARRLNHWYTSRKVVPESVQCSYCGDPLPKGTMVVSQKLYAWPKPPPDPENDSPPSGGGKVATGVRATAAGVTTSAQRTHSGMWKNLRPKTQRLFRTRGLGRGLGSRSPKMAQRLYNSVPDAIRNQGEGAVLGFLKGKHASHKKSVSKMPGWARRPSNIVWESAKPNLSRGSRTMRVREVAAVKSANRVSGISATTRGVAKGGAIAAVIEAPVAGVENFLHWKRGRKSRGKAAADAAKSTVGAAVVGAGVTAATVGVTQGATLIGISPTLGPAGVPLAAAGVALMVGITACRLYKANQKDLPLDEYYLYFHNDSDCKTKFAEGVTDGAFGRGQKRYVWTLGLALAGLAVSAILVGTWLI